MIGGGLCKVLSKCGRYVYHIAIIDYLTVYNFNKIFERYTKSLVHPIKDLSAAPPTFYQERFYKFTKDEIFKNNK